LYAKERRHCKFPFIIKIGRHDFDSFDFEPVNVIGRSVKLS